jgi:hypothetical protein
MPSRLKGRGTVEPVRACDHLDQKGMTMRVRLTILSALCLLLLGACGGDTPAVDDTTAAPTPPPTTTSPPPGPLSPDATFTSGTATASTTGDRTESFEAALDTESTNGFGGDEDLELEFVASNGWVIRFDFTATGPGAAESDWVAVGMPGESIDDPEYYFDGFETLCETTITQYDSAGVAGTYTCAELPNSEGSMTIDVQGAFSATP